MRWVTSGRILASARALDLDFIAREQYDICVLPALIEPEALDCIITTIKSPGFLSRVETFGGYDLSMPGQVVWRSSD